MHRTGPPRLLRPPRPGPCLNFGLQLTLSQPGGHIMPTTVLWALSGSNSPWRPWNMRPEESSLFKTDQTSLQLWDQTSPVGHERTETSMVLRDLNYILHFQLYSIFIYSDIGKRRDMLLEKRSTLQDKSARRKVKLADSYLYQQFDRDITETKSWFNEKLKVANDENYLDPTNLSGKLQKHQNFDGELSANKNR
jgi:hypothetical protein